MFVKSYSVKYCVYIPGKPGSVFIIIVQFWSVQIVVYVWLADRIRLFVHYTISFSSLFKLLWRYWTYKMPVIYILSSVWARLIIFSQLFSVQYMGLCVLGLPIFLVMIEIINILCLIIIIKSEAWAIIHCLGSGRETMVCTVCLSIFVMS